MKKDEERMKKEWRKNEERMKKEWRKERENKKKQTRNEKHIWELRLFCQNLSIKALNHFFKQHLWTFCNLVHLLFFRLLTRVEEKSQDL